MSDLRDAYEVVVCGAGIAGASICHFLAERGMTDVLLIEREDHAALHTTGRSAAVLFEIEDSDVMLAIKASAARFLRQPPPGFCEVALLHAAGVLALYSAGWARACARMPAMEALGIQVRALSPAEAVARVPVLEAATFQGGLLLPAGGNIDVHALLGAYLGHARRHGVKVLHGADLRAVRVDRGRVVSVTAGEREIGCRVLVDAAGAWAGEVARLAGATPIPMSPLRRTIVTFDPPAGVDAGGWPFVAHEDDRVYFGRESGGLLASPMDETPSPPCDARPDDLAIATVMDRLGRLAPALVPRTLRRAWAGLRTFAPDRLPVIGPDPRLGGFFWCAGQGGSGIETSPVLGDGAAELLLAGHTDRFDAAALAPSRSGA